MGGRGAGRGRGKPREQQQAAPQPGQPRGGPSYAQMGGGSAAAPMPQQPKAPAPTAWGPPGGGAARATHRPPPKTEMVQQMGGLSLGPADSGSRPPPAGQPSSSGSAASGGNGGASGPVGRGAQRGNRRLNYDEMPRTRVTRPSELATKHGMNGDPIGLFGNYFALQTHPDWALRRYRVDIAPEEDRTRERQNLLRVHREQLGGYLFDGTVLFTINPLTSPQKPTLTLTSHDREQKNIYTITIKEAGEVDRFDFAYIQVFNVLLRSCICALELKLVGRDYYDAKAGVTVPEFRLELWPGYKTSIRQHEKNILLCVEITHKVMRMETALDILHECYNRDQANYKSNFVKEVVGCIVLTKYNNKTYRIDDVDWGTNPTGTFKYRDEEITYAQYMERKYELRIRDMRQPMLVSRAKARDVRAGMLEVINLLPEVCYLTGLTDAMRSNFRLMQALAVHTRVSPASRIDKLLNFNKRLQDSPEALAQLKKFDMKLDRNLVTVPGRKLKDEKILFARGFAPQAGPQADWTRELRKCALLNAKELANWVVVTPGKWRRDAGAFVECLKRTGSGMGFRIADPQWVEVMGDHAAAYVQTLGGILDRGLPQLIMCAVPNNRGDRYSAIKKKCCVDRAVPTQVILTKNLNDPKKTMSVATKVCIQLNCKIGGSPWSVEIPLPSVMVVGFDVCHDTSNKGLDFGAMVASLDKPLSRYFSAVTPHKAGEELSNNLALNIVKALRKFSEVNGSLPQRIIIYRDGVGEGQIQHVITHEVQAINGKLAEVYKTFAPKMTFIIVTKRINTRLFTQSQKGNPPPGTFVDDVVTDPEKYDFFLVSQSVNQGTVSPSSYNVIQDGVGLTPDRLQKLTYKLCHLYFNWSGTVRVPAPCQYAHKLAFLVGQALHREPSAALEDLLYFL